MQPAASAPLCPSLHAPPDGGPRAAGDGKDVSGPVLISEISGSDSVIHFGLGGSEGNTWVSQAHGVQPHPVGEAATFSLDIGHCLYFDAAGRRLAA